MKEIRITELRTALSAGWMRDLKETLMIVDRLGVPLGIISPSLHLKDVDKSAKRVDSKPSV